MKLTKIEDVYMFKRRNRIMGLIGLTVLILLGVGLYLAHKNQEFQNEMTEIVHSEEVKNLIEKKLKKLCKFLVYFLMFSFIFLDILIY